MLIDWFTVGAQALNFVILVWLMKRFLYKPILDAIDAREKRISTALADADRKKTEAQQEHDAYQQKSDDFDKQRAALLKTATTDADAEHQKLLDAARRAADGLAAQRQASLASEAKALGQALRERAQTEVFAIARRALIDLATVSLEVSACEVFIARLRGLEGQAKEALAQALRGADDGVVVRSAFELPSAQQHAIHDTLADIFGIELEVRYESAPALVGGIELVARGEKFAWTISDYLASLERSVSELLKAPTHRPLAVPAPAADPPVGPVAQPASAIPGSRPTAVAAAP